MKHRRAVRIAAWSTGALVVFLLAPPMFFFALGAKFNPAPPRNDFAPPANALEAQRQDVTQFSRMIALDRSYSPSTRVEADRRIAALLTAASPLDNGHFRVALMEIAALADNGHTMLSGGDGDPSTLPIRATLFSDGFYVLQARDTEADLLGARVEAIEGRPTDQVLSTLGTLQGGGEGWRKSLAAVYATSPEILYGAGLAAGLDDTKWMFRMPDGAIVERTLAAEAERNLNGWPRGMTGSRWLLPEAPAADGEAWQVLVSDEATLPLSLRYLRLGFRRFRPGNSCILAVQMRAILDIGSIKIGDFLRETEDEMRADPPCALILDLRFNSGGNYAYSYGFARGLPDLVAPSGSVYVLTSPQTFSAAITTTAFVKQAMGSRAVILGEPVGDRLAFWAEGGQGCLPNGKFCFNYATGKHDYSQPCTDWSACFWLNWFYPVRVDSLAPDETIAMSFADYAAGRDPVFERAVTLANRGVR